MTALTTVVLPTVGRASLGVLLESLAKQDHAVESPVLVVDDRPDPGLAPLRAEELEPTGTLALQVLRSGGRGPAGARNLGWRHARTPWVTFLDDDVVTPPDWYRQLLADLDAAEAAGQVGSQARIVVPLPEGRRPTDDERATIGLATAAWITADMSGARSWCGSAVSTSASPGPSAKTPTSRSGSAPTVAGSPRAGGAPSTPSSTATSGSPSASRGATPTTA